MSTYVYGITSASAASEAKRLDTSATDVRTVAWRKLAAIVSDSGQRVVAKASARQLRAHARVLASAVELGWTVVPLRFGTIVDSDEMVVEEILVPYHEPVTTLLLQLADRVEISVRATYREDVVIADIAANDRVTAQMHAEIAGKDPNATHWDRVRLGERVAALLEERRARDADALYEGLASVADDADEGELLDQQMVINGAFLVRRGKLPEFDRRVDAIASAHPEMEFRCVGPLPPYSFSEFGGLDHGPPDEDPHFPGICTHRWNDLDRRADSGSRTAGVSRVHAAWAAA